MPKPDYDTTIARVAGNILSGMFIEDANEDKCVHFVWKSVARARAIVEEVKRTTPQQLAGLTENRGNIQQSDTRVQAGHRLETEG